MSHRIERLKVCLNGGRHRAEHPALPVSPTELAAAATGAVGAGAEAIHLHPRDAAGQESLQAADIGAAVAAVRRACPGVPVGVSTGLWIARGDVRARRDLVARWTELPEAGRPDFASVNVSEAGFGELSRVLHAAGIAVEAGVWSAADAQALAGTDLAGVVRVLVEIIGGTATDAVPSADAVLRRLDELGVAVPRLLHGEEAACWPLVAHAGRLGLPARIGLEDTLVGPDGEAVAGNAGLVRLALAAWSRAQVQ